MKTAQITEEMRQRLIQLGFKLDESPSIIDRGIVRAYLRDSCDILDQEILELLAPKEASDVEVNFVADK